MTAVVAASRFRPADVARSATLGVRCRPLRTALTALGIAIGIAAMVAVVGISASSRANLIAQLDGLGTDLLRVTPGQTAFGNATNLPESARAVAARIGPVNAAAGTTTLAATVRRTPLISPLRTGGIQAVAADIATLDAVSGTIARGRWLDHAAERLPAAVLGSRAAAKLGLTNLAQPVRLWVGGHWLTVIGVLDPLPLAPELDNAVIVGYPVAAELWDTTRSPTTLYVRSDPEAVDAVRGVLGRSIRPDAPNEADISRPSDALAARAATNAALRNLLLALGGVALVVGGLGITNVMVISVLERRAEIGVRRALGAARRHIAAQFLAEAATLATIGGVSGVGLGAAVTAVVARQRQWIVDVPLDALFAGAALALAIGLLAGVSPAVRASRLDPADALRPV